MFTTKLSAVVFLSLAALSQAAPANVQKQNALDAQKQNSQFAGLDANSSCNGMSTCSLLMRGSHSSWI